MGQNQRVNSRIDRLLGPHSTLSLTIMMQHPPTNRAVLQDNSQLEKKLEAAEEKVVEYAQLSEFL